MPRTSIPALQSTASAVVTALFVASAGFAPGAAAQTPTSQPTVIEYGISFPNARHREAEVVVHYRDLGPGPLRLRMSRTSPGRYALHEFAKNVYDVRVEGGAGPVDVERPDLHEWVVEGHGGEVTVRYTLYADRADGTYSQVDDSHAHLNVPATFMYAPDLMSTPISLTVDPGDRPWDVATQLFPDPDDPMRFTAPDHWYFMDSPLEIADLAWREHALPDGQVLRVAMHHLGDDEELDRYAAHTWAIADQLAAVFGGWPEFDGGTYTFLACYTPWSSGDGMEHRNSTVLTSSSSLETNLIGLLGTVAHEFVHTWNMERIRSAAIEPFDFEAANMSRELWFGEGFTSYLDDVALVRAGVIDEASFLRRVAGNASAAILAPGRRFYSPVEMSMQAPFVDAATSVDPQNRGNTFLSYYTWGAAVGLGLDLTLRTRFGLTLEDYLQDMWRGHGAPERPYDLRDLETSLAAVTGDAIFARDFFARFVEGREVPDYAALFDDMGVDFGPAGPDTPWPTGAQLRPAPGGVFVASNTTFGDPFYLAGLDRGDLIQQVNGAPATGEAMEAAVRAAGVGGEISLAVDTRGERRVVRVVLQAAPGYTATARPGASSAANAARAAWIAPIR